MEKENIKYSPFYAQCNKFWQLLIKYSYTLQNSDTPVLCLTLKEEIARSIIIIRHNQQENNYDIIDVSKLYDEIYNE